MRCDEVRENVEELGSDALPASIREHVFDPEIIDFDHWWTVTVKSVVSIAPQSAVAARREQES